LVALVLGEWLVDDADAGPPLACRDRGYRNAREPGIRGDRPQGARATLAECLDPHRLLPADVVGRQGLQAGDGVVERVEERVELFRGHECHG
jgi:hypothetical protein